MSLPLFILTLIGCYFAVWLIVSYFSSKGADNSVFFTGGRKMPWPLVAVAMIGAPITGVTFISVPGMVMAKGMSYLQMCLGFFIGYLVIAFVLVPIYYRYKIVSIYGFLEKRFGKTSSRTGAWLFFVSKILGVSVRFLVVCAMLQLLVFDPLGIPYYLSVILSIMLIWLTTVRGGVKSVIWGDVLKSICLISAIALCLWFVAQNLGFNFSELSSRISNDEASRIFFFDNPSDGKYFWKQFIAGIFIVVAMTGLDQDMMQRTLACRNAKDSAKNLLVGSVMQCVVIGCLLILGVLMMLFVKESGEMLPERSDNLFATVAFHEGIPLIVGALFIIGLVSSTYSSIASALTSMTTSVTYDILEMQKGMSADQLAKKRTCIHLALAAAMVALVICFFYLNNDDAISMVYTLISFTDGPILGVFLFGILSKRDVNEKWLPVVCFSAPVIAWLIQWSVKYFFQYEIGFELLILNGAITFLGMRAIATLPSSKKISLSSFSQD